MNLHVNTGNTHSKTINDSIKSVKETKVENYGALNLFCL